MNTSDVIDIPVVISGGGPVGLVVAMFLDRLGVPSTILNTEMQARWLPKGSTHNSRTMEHYRALGIAQRIRALGLPSDYPTDTGFFSQLNGYEILRQPMPSESEKLARAHNAPVTDQVPEPIFRANQMYVERFLLEHARSLPQIDVRFGWSCKGVVDHGSHVIVTAEEVATGRIVTFRSRYLAGCDGAQGFARRHLGIHYDGPPNYQGDYYGGPMLRTHMRVPEFYQVVAAKPCLYYQVINPAARCNIIALNGLDEFILGSRREFPDEKTDEDKLRRLVCTAIGKDVSVEFLGHSTWTSGITVVAQSYGNGRIWLAGDSAHLFTPAGAFGMNTGVDDAVNLAWKLAAAVQGWGGPDLVPSYASERRPIGQRNTAAARALTSGGGTASPTIGPAIDVDSREGEEQRRALAQHLEVSSPEERHASLGIQLGARYDGSSVIADDGTSPPHDDPGIYVPSACPGGRAPHFWLPGHVSLFDQLGPGFTVLSLNGDINAAAPIVEAASKRGVPIRSVVTDVPEGRELYGRNLALIRPDQIVAWRGDSPPEDCDGLIAQVTGW